MGGKERKGSQEAAVTVGRPGLRGRGASGSSTVAPPEVRRASAVGCAPNRVSSQEMGRTAPSFRSVQQRDGGWQTLACLRMTSCRMSPHLSLRFPVAL